MDHQVSCELDDEAVILSLKDGLYYGLNPVAARIWGLVQEKPRTFGSICALLTREYDVAEDRCEREVRILMNRLIEWSLIEVVTPERMP
jgi:hypothetical protein